MSGISRASSGGGGGGRTRRGGVIELVHAHRVPGAHGGEVGRHVVEWMKMRCGWRDRGKGLRGRRVRRRGAAAAGYAGRQGAGRVPPRGRAYSGRSRRAAAAHGRGKRRTPRVCARATCRADALPPASARVTAAVRPAPRAARVHGRTTPQAGGQRARPPAAGVLRCSPDGEWGRTCAASHLPAAHPPGTRSSRRPRSPVPCRAV